MTNLTINDYWDIVWGTLYMICFMCFLMGLLFAPMLGVFLFVWVLTTNVIAALILGVIAEFIYLYVWVVG
jgi:hypothetical protein